MKKIEELQMDGKWQILRKVFKGLQSWKLPKGDYLELRATNEWLCLNDDIQLVEYDNFHTAGKAFLVQLIDKD